MASYPDAVKSFTTKNTGDNIAAAHVNDLQDEVNALEGGLLNGTARLNSSNSTHVNLSVTGGSTLGTLVAGASTLTSLQTGASTFTARPVAPPPHAAVVFLDSTVTLGSSATSTIAWLAQAVLTNSTLHSTASNPAQLVPQSTGLYQFTAQLAFSSNSTGMRQVGIVDSSGTLLAAQRVGASSFTINLSVTGYKRYDQVGGHAVCVATMADQSTLSLSTGVGQSFFAMVKL